MDAPDTLHAGIELDAICLPALGREAVGENRVATQSDASDHSLFVKSIFKKMVAHDSFLSFSRQVSDVNKILTMKYSSANDIADVILKDMALTSKVLKLVNSSFYRHFSPKGISTISEAMIILGTDEIRSAAASLKIYEMMKGLANADVLKEKALKGLQRSIMARQMGLEGGYKDSDALQISAMIYDLGEYLVALFAPDKYIRIEIAMDEDKLTRQEASKSILGISYSDLGRLVALKLHLPENVVNAMRPVTNFDVKREEISEGNRHRYACAFTMEMCDIPMDKGRDLALEKARVIVLKYKGVLRIDMSKAMELVKTSRDKMEKHAALLNIDSDKTRSEDRSSGVKNMDSLNAGLKQIKENLESELSIHEIFTNIVEILFNSFYFTQVCISIKKKETHTMDARFAKGEISSEFLKGFSFQLENSPDIFNRAVLKKSDIIVRDIHKERSKKKIPSWYMDQFGGKMRVSGFAVFPVFVDQKIISMMYLGWDTSAHSIDQKTIDYLRVFRELIVKTFTLHAR